MKVRWLKDHLLGGGREAQAGQVSEELHPMEAQRKISMGYAQLLGEGPDHPAPPTSVAGHEQTSGDPTLARRGGK
jgi:hypothetical protein